MQLIAFDLPYNGSNKYSDSDGTTQDFKELDVDTVCFGWWC